MFLCLPPGPRASSMFLLCSSWLEVFLQFSFFLSSFIPLTFVRLPFVVSILDFSTHQLIPVDRFLLFNLPPSVSVFGSFFDEM